MWTQPQTNWVKMIRNTDVTFVSMPASLNSSEDAELCIIQKCECWTCVFLFVVVVRVAPCFFGGLQLNHLRKKLVHIYHKRTELSQEKPWRWQHCKHDEDSGLGEAKSKEWTLITTSTVSDVKQHFSNMKPPTGWTWHRPQSVCNNWRRFTWDLPPFSLK